MTTPLSPVLMQTWTRLRMLSIARASDLAQALGVRPATVQRRLQELKSRGYADNNAKRGTWCRWHAITPKVEGDASPTKVANALAVRVHQALRETPGWYTPQQLAAMLQLPLTSIEEVMRELAGRDILRELGGRYDVAAVGKARPEQASELVEEWWATLSEAALRSLSHNDRRRLEAELRAWVSR